MSAASRPAAATPAKTVLAPRSLPERFADVEALEEFLSTPSQALIDDLVAVEEEISRTFQLLA
jgi:hypothetical protein